MAQVQKLRDYLNSIPAGKITDVGGLRSVLAPCWNQFSDACDKGMEGYKLDRMEDVSWDPPVLSFTIERHGGTVLGSTRGELQCWSVDVETLSATCSTASHRQLKPMQPKLDVKAIAEGTVALILERRQEPRLKWNPDGSVRVLISRIIRSGSAVQQTLAGRRKGLRDEIERLLTERGWHKVRMDVYAPTSS